MMLRRAALAAFILYQAFWLNAVVPGHTRGLVTVGCGSCVTPARGGAAPCHPKPATKAAKCCPPGKGGGGQPTKGDRERCAICFFAAGLMVAPPPETGLERAGVLEILDTVTPERAAVQGRFAAYLQGRAPPVG